MTSPSSSTCLFARSTHAPRSWTAPDHPNLTGTPRRWASPHHGYMMKSMILGAAFRLELGQLVRRRGLDRTPVHNPRWFFAGRCRNCRLKSSAVVEILMIKTLRSVMVVSWRCWRAPDCRSGAGWGKTKKPAAESAAAAQPSWNWCMSWGRSGRRADADRRPFQCRVSERPSA